THPKIGRRGLCQTRRAGLAAGPRSALVRVNPRRDLLLRRDADVELVEDADLVVHDRVLDTLDPWLAEVLRRRVVPPRGRRILAQLLRCLQVRLVAALRVRISVRLTDSLVEVSTLV